MPACVDNNFELIAIEPSKENLSLLLKNIFINGIKAKIYCCALVDKVTEKTTDEPKKEPVETPKFDEKWVKVEPVEVESAPLNFAEEMPGFVGGDKALYEYLSNNIKYPKREKQIGIEGKVYVEFVVGKKGEITDVKIKRGVSEALDAEAIRVIKSMPNWLPGKQNGRAVKVIYVMPISFKIIT